MIPVCNSPFVMSAHEQTDARTKWVFAVVFLLAVLVAVSQFVLSGYLNSLKHKPTPADPWHPVSRTPAAAQAASPFPLLQVSPSLDLERFRTREEAELHSYGWINRTGGVVRIPIERAMDLVL